MAEPSQSKPKKSSVARGRAAQNGKRAEKARRTARALDESQAAQEPLPPAAAPYVEPEKAPDPKPYIERIDETVEKMAMGEEPIPSYESLQKMQEELALQERKNEMLYGLPFLYGWKFYPWAREFFESRNKQNFLCAANQISKSSTQIRKAIHWATDQSLWPQLWMRKPSQFWYLYPSQEVVNIEFKLKWEREFLPRGAFKNDPVYGWRELKDRGNIIGIEFNSGVFLFFKTYTKDVQHLQTGTCDAIFCDEELPVDLYDELIMRLNATDGYFHMVFTATIGQDLWRRCMEPDEKEEEAFPTAAKWTVSLYEAMLYDDGTRSHWTEERIAAVKAKCKSHLEVLKRVYGRFIILEGRKYPTFDATKHTRAPHPLPASWSVYCGVDSGSGGETGHPAAICFVAVSPDYRQGRVFLGWRGDKIQTTDGDVVEKYLDLKNLHRVKQEAGRVYDHASKDFDIISTRMGHPFQKANKSHEYGEGVLNTLFKNNMLLIYEDHELAKLARELATLREGQSKKHAKDDFIDALRYAVAAVPWDFSGILGEPADYIEKPEEVLTPLQKEIRERREAFEKSQEDAEQNLEDEFSEWNEAYG